MTPPGPVPFPTPDAIEAFIRDCAEPPSLREIARAFHLRGAGRARLKQVLREMAEAGRLSASEAGGEAGRADGDRPDNGGSGRGRPARRAEGEGPLVSVLLVEEVDAEGIATGRPLHWPRPPLTQIRILPGRGPALAAGDRVLARLDWGAAAGPQARVMRRLDPLVEQRVVGLLRGRAQGRPRVEPLDGRDREDWPVEGTMPADAADGDLVVATVTEDRVRRRRRAVVTERIGDPDAPGAFGLIAIHAAGIPVDFPPDAVAQAEAARPVPLGTRTDLRGLPLVTIDGADARDFDDAVYAEPDPETGGWRIIVAIADVAHYVTPGSPLDRAARERGNSVYLPDRVVPMLPEALSNGLCSLRPGEDRACLAAELVIDDQGRLRRHRFLRGLMRSAARLTYEQLQAARNGAPDAVTAPLMERVIAPLYGAFAALATARAERGTLELDLPERVVRLDEAGRVREIGVRPRLDSHRLIETFMIVANVAAAETLETARVPTLFRVHDQPDAGRIDALREALAPFGYRIARGSAARPAIFAGVLDRARGRPEEALVAEMILRTQAQAVYAPQNFGHFGLALPRYVHFTSPIRRYADLVVHRGLIRHLRLGPDGLSDAEAASLDQIGAHVSMTERRAALAEREAVDRYAAAWLGDRIGTAFTARIAGVVRFGLFVAVADGAASGLVPVEALPDDYYDHDPATASLTGRRWGRVFRLGATVRVRLVAVDVLAGQATFALLDAEEGADLEGARPRRARGRGGPVRPRSGGRGAPKGRGTGRRSRRGG